ncbi:hypothetical protein RAS1_02180 [Phycisphaerae bacterium RAS1]|nr:hypothetical protein RAS1_02180 [Phycisphaerae bacterium RAS1]
MYRRYLRCFHVTFAILMLAPAAIAQTLPEQQKLLAKRAAEADAYRKLAEAVYGVQLNSTTHVQDFVAESDQIRGMVDSFIRGIRLGTPTWYDDGSCEVPAEVTVAKVIDTIREAHSRHYNGDRVKSTDFESVTQRTEKQIIKVVGMGAPRVDLPPDLPQGVAEMLPPPASPPPPAIPDIWKKIGPQARLMAVEAARKDAQRRLAERIKGLRLTARTQVRDFAVESDTINTELNATLIGAREVTTYLHHDELIAEVTMAVPVEKVITTIKELHTRHYKGDDVRGTDIETAVRTVVKDEFQETGMGVPNPKFIKKYQEQFAPAMPEWAMIVFEIDGEGTDPEVSTSIGRLRAYRLAEADARRKLKEKLLGLPLEGGATFGVFAEAHETLSSRVDKIVLDAVVADDRVVGDRVVIRLTLPGMRVWGSVTEEMQRDARR